MKHAALLITALVPAFSWAQNDLTFDIVNDRNQDVYIYFANSSITGTAPAAAGGGAITTNINNSDSNAYMVPANSSLSGFTISDFSSGRVFMSLGETLASGNGSQFNAPGSTDFNKRFDHFEITYSTGNSASGANLTGTDFISMPIQLSNGSSTVKWTPPSFATALTQVTNTLQNTSANGVGDAVVTGPNGVNIPGIGDVVRVIAPSTAVAGPDTPFNPIANYPDAMRTGTIANNTIHVMSDQFGNNYNLQGSVAANGDVVLTKFGGQGTINSITVDSSFFTSEAIYGANPSEATIDGVLTQSSSFTSNEAAAIRDIYAGFNLGVWGSTEDVGGTPLGEFTSQEFFALGSVSSFFSNAQSNPDYYNAYAEAIASNSDNAVYGFPYSDVLGGQFIDLDPSGTPTLTLTILPDVVPEPSTYALIAGVLILAGAIVMRRRK